MAIIIRLIRWRFALSFSPLIDLGDLRSIEKTICVALAIIYLFFFKVLYCTLVRPMEIIKCTN